MSFKPRIAITGATGVLGQWLCRSWTEVDFRKFSGDIRVHGEVNAWLNGEGPFDGLIHLAAVVPIAIVEADPFKAFEVNVQGTCYLLESCRKLSQPIPWIFVASSSHVYNTRKLKNDFDPSGKVSESHVLDCVSTYGTTKAQADQWAEIYRQNFQLPICTGRIFSFSAVGQQMSYFIPSMIQKIKSAPQGAVLEIRGLEGTRDFLTLSQLTQAIRFLFDKKATGVFNIGTGTPVKLLEVAEAIKKRLARADVIIKATSTDTHHLYADTTKLESLGLKLDFDLSKFLDSVFSLS